MNDPRAHIEEALAHLQEALRTLPSAELPGLIIDAIATKGHTQGQRDDLTASALASLRAGTPAAAIADAIYQGLLSDDGE